MTQGVQSIARFPGPFTSAEAGRVALFLPASFRPGAAGLFICAES